jgi:hypothetical protein
MCVTWPEASTAGKMQGSPWRKGRKALRREAEEGDAPLESPRQDMSPEGHTLDVDRTMVPGEVWRIS